MDLIKEAVQFPESNLLGIFIYLTLFFILTVSFLTIALYLIPNRLSSRWKSTIIGSITFIVLIIWLYYFVFKQFI